jgi:hypothetical protein
MSIGNLCKESIPKRTKKPDCRIWFETGFADQVKLAVGVGLDVQNVAQDIEQSGRIRTCFRDAGSSIAPRQPGASTLEVGPWLTSINPQLLAAQVADSSVPTFTSTNAVLDRRFGSRFPFVALGSSPETLAELLPPLS